MGSGCETAHEAVDKLLGMGEKVGVLKVRLYRPFSVEHFAAALPQHPSSPWPCSTAPRNRDRRASPSTWTWSTPSPKPGAPCGSSAAAIGLSSKEFTPSMVKAVFDELREAAPKNHFTLGIEDDLTHLSLVRRRKLRRASSRACSAPCSTAWAPTAPSGPTRTPSRSSARTPRTTSRATSSTTPRRPACSP